MQPVPIMTQPVEKVGFDLTETFGSSRSETQAVKIGPPKAISRLNRRPAAPADEFFNRVDDYRNRGDAEAYGRSARNPGRRP